MDDLFVIPADTLVTINDEITGLVLAVDIRAGNRVQYEVAWWKAGIRYVATLQESELVVQKETKLQRIGFHGGKDA